MDGFGGCTMTDKALIMILPVAMFVVSGFEHSIANMFMIPVGIVIENFAAPEFWTLSASSNQFMLIDDSKFCYQ